MKNLKKVGIISLILFSIFFFAGCGGGQIEPGAGGESSTVNFSQAPSSAKETGATYYVNVNAGNNANDGTTPATAWKTLTYATTNPIIVAGDTILVAEGIYSQLTGETFAIKPKNGTTMIGGYDSNFLEYDLTKHKTIISSLWRTTGKTYRGVRFISCGPETLFKGFIIDDNVVPAINGGGIAIDTNSSPVIEDCTISNNYAGKDGGGGGGIFITASSPIIQNCTIINNTAKNYGAGIFMTADSKPIFKKCTITGNRTKTYDGGGIYVYESSPNILECLIYNNVAAQRGGGIHIVTTNLATNPCSPYLYDCDIFSNTANQSGGGIYVVKATPLIDYCRLYGNSAPEGGATAFERAAGSTNETIAYYNNSYLGAGVYTAPRTDAVAQNCLIYDNSANYGGAIACRQNSYPLIANCTVYSNDAAHSGGAFYAINGSNPFIASSIITSNAAITSGGGIYTKNDGSQVAIVYSDIWENTIGTTAVQDAYNEEEGGTEGMSEGEILLTLASWNWDATGCLSRDPLFVAPTNLDFLLHKASPCIDAGDPAYIGNLIDGNWKTIDGNWKITTVWDTLPVDMGFHYYLKSKF